MRKLKIAGLIVVALGIAAAVWWRGASTVPVISIPTPKMRVRNARDYYNQAVGAMRETKKIGYAIENTLEACQQMIVHANRHKLARSW